jgi:hypothetical protein
MWRLVVNKPINLYEAFSYFNNLKHDRANFVVMWKKMNLPQWDSMGLLGEIVHRNGLNSIIILIISL